MNMLGYKYYLTEGLRDERGMKECLSLLFFIKSTGGGGVGGMVIVKDLIK